VVCAGIVFWQVRQIGKLQFQRGVIAGHFATRWPQHCHKSQAFLDARKHLDDIEAEALLRGINLHEPAEPWEEN
jgi:hypothetical protein